MPKLKIDINSAFFMSDENSRFPPRPWPIRNGRRTPYTAESSGLFTAMEQQMLEQRELQAYERTRRRNGLLRSLDRAVRKGDRALVMELASTLCAMEAWRWGVEADSLKSRQTRSAGGRGRSGKRGKAQ